MMPRRSCGLERKDLPDAPLLDDGVAFRPQAAAHEDVLDVAQPRLPPVDQVFAFARPEQTPRDGDFAALARPPVFHRLNLVCACVFIGLANPPTSWVQ